eukprot:11147761-Alexandrium_andersonii.AAC.1
MNYVVRSHVHQDDRKRMNAPGSGAHILHAVGLRGFVSQVGLWPHLPKKVLTRALTGMLRLRPDFQEGWITALSGGELRLRTLQFNLKVPPFWRRRAGGWLPAAGVGNSAPVPYTLSCPAGCGASISLPAKPMR